MSTLSLPSKTVLYIIAGIAVLLALYLVAQDYTAFHSVPPGNMLIPNQAQQASSTVSDTSATTGDDRPFTSETTNRPCLIAAENFFEAKRVTDVELYSASWTGYYEKSSGMCFVQITNSNGSVIYDVASGHQYYLQGKAIVK
jgi:hypothetical protein